MERVVDDRLLRRGQCLVERLQGWLDLLHPGKLRLQELLAPVQPVEHGDLGVCVRVGRQGGAELVLLVGMLPCIAASTLA